MLNTQSKAFKKAEQLSWFTVDKGWNKMKNETVGERIRLNILMLWQLSANEKAILTCIVSKSSGSSHEKWQNAIYTDTFWLTFDVHLPLPPNMKHYSHTHTHTQTLQQRGKNCTIALFWVYFVRLLRVSIEFWLLLLLRLFFYVSIRIMIIATWYCFRAGRIYLYRALACRLVCVVLGLLTSVLPTFTTLLYRLRDFYFTFIISPPLNWTSMRPRGWCLTLIYESTTKNANPSISSNLST